MTGREQLLSDHCRADAAGSVSTPFILAEGEDDPFGAELAVVRQVPLQSAWFAEANEGLRQLEELAQRSGANCLTELRRLSRVFRASRREATLHSWAGYAGIYAPKDAAADPAVVARAKQVCAALQLDSADLDEYRQKQEKGRGFLVYLSAAFLLGGLALLGWLLAA